MSHDMPKPSYECFLFCDGVKNLARCRHVCLNLFLATHMFSYGYIQSDRADKQGNVADFKI